jgi:hypothetical protein
MRAIPFLCLSLLFLSNPALAYDGIFKILDEKYINSIIDLPESLTLKPNITWQTSGDIQAWIDIVGYRDMIRDNGIDYVPGNPADYAIVQYGVSTGELKSRIVLDYRVKCYWCFVSSVHKKLEVFQNGANITARLHVTLNWYEAVVNSGSISVISYSESAVFETTQPSPQKYNQNIDDLPVFITEYNNTFAPKTVIYVSGAPNVIAVTYDYQGEQLTHYRKLAHVEKTDKGISFANTTDVDFWGDNTKYLHHMNQWAVLPNTSRPDYGSLKITASNLYESKVLKNITVSRETYRPESTFSNLLLMFVSVLATFLFMSIFVIRRL